MFEVDPLDIVRLNAEQLTELLRKLLHAEASERGIASRHVQVSLQINVADGGEDGNISWVGGPDPSGCLPDRTIGFQCKAVNQYGSTAAADEIVTANDDVKPLVDEVLAAGGTYIVFVSIQLNRQQIDERIASIRERLREKGKAYSAAAKILFYDAGQIAKWASSYISTLLAVYTWANKATVLGAKTWDEWHALRRNVDQPYQTTAELDQYLHEIQNAVSQPRQAVRIVGLSGLGKTRLVLEAFRRQSGAALRLGAQLADSVAYVDAHGQNALPQQLSDWQRTKPRGTLIVDNCRLSLHVTLENEIKGADSKLSLVTIDYAVEEIYNKCRVIKLSSLPEEKIKALLTENGTIPSTPDTDRVVSFARGFPEIAVRLADARVARVPDAGRINDSFLLQKLLWGRRLEVPRGLEAITAIALFEQVGFDGAVTNELEQVAQLVCKWEVRDLRRELAQFLDSGILEQHGHFLRVRLPPLAVELSANWWRSCHPPDGLTLIESLEGRLSTAMCERMQQLDFLPEAQQFAGQLCGDQGPFGQAEVLNTDRGSTIFRALSEVNPIAAVNAMERAFGRMSLSELSEVGPGRRNLIWALEKLVFRKTTFIPAAEMLLRFAAAENETWSNNATGHFLQLFHVQLSGTEAEPNLRIDVLDRALSSLVPKEKDLAIQALNSALEANHYSRTGGPERQGSGPVLEDWRPKFWSEAFDYWKAIIDRLEILALSDNPSDSEMATQILANRLPGLLVSEEMVSHLDAAILLILNKTHGQWPALYEMANRALSFSKKLHPSAKLKLQEWKDISGPENQPRDLRLRMLVSDLSGSQLYSGSGDGYLERAQKAANSFALIVAANFDEWLPDIKKVLFHGDQRQGYFFGKALGAMLQNPKVLIDAALDALSDPDKPGANPIVLGGLLSAIENTSPELVAATLQSVRDSEKLRHLYIDVLRFVTISDVHLLDALHLVDLNFIPVESLRQLAFGSVLSELPVPVVVAFADRIINFGSKGAWIALDILFMYSFARDIADEEKSALRRVVLSESLNLTDQSSQTMDMYHFEEVTVKLLGVLDAELASNISEKIVAACKAKKTVFEIPEKIVEELLKINCDTSWPILANALLSDDPLLVYQMCSLLGVGYHSKQSGGVLFRTVSSDVLMKWCDENSEKAPAILARMVQVFAPEPNPGWSDFARFLIDKYGQSEHVLSNLDSNLGTYSWSGSIIPYYEMQVRLFEVLRFHQIPNVKKWASRHLMWLDEAMREEKKREEDRHMGIF